ncbi:hypothetical protein OKA06_12280 [Novosphingobium sp. MW5]|nr:hypothetical protein [Novosphingobium sp. MW5]
MPEWLVEEGIGEHRAVLVDRGRIIGARVDWLEAVRPGLIAEAQLVSRPRGSSRGVVRLADGSEVLVDRLPAGATEGTSLLVEITRAAIAERGRNKMPLARPAISGASKRAGPSLFDELKAGELHVTRCRPADGAFNDLGWDELVEEALSGAVAFAGGSLTIDPTPAMTVIDIDGHLPRLDWHWRPFQPSRKPLHGSTSPVQSPSTFPRLNRARIGRSRIRRLRKRSTPGAGNGPR